MREFIFNVIRSRLYRYGMDDPHDLAEDLTQEAMIKVWKYGHGNERKVYLYTIAKSVIADHFHKKSRPKHHHHFVELKENSAVHRDYCCIDADEMYEHLSDIMKMYIEGSTCTEIAEKYKMNLSTVHTKMHRERKEINVLCRQI